MTLNSFTDTDGVDWFCEPCGVKPKPHKAKLTYLGANFEVLLLRCPQCGQFFISKDLAEGKMREAENLLEDK